MIGHYPDEAAGVRVGSIGGTAEVAAALQLPGLKAMLAAVQAEISRAPGTAEELTKRLQAKADHRIMLSTIRSRCSQLARLGFVVDSGERGVSDSGRAKSVAWREARPEETAAYLAQRETAR